MNSIDLKRGIDFTGITCTFFCHDGKGNILLHKRSNKCRDEKGKWDCGSGALEFGEHWEEGAKREIQEEYGVKPISCKFAGVTNVLRKNGNLNTHWVAFIFAAKVFKNKVKVCEPEKVDAIGWFPMNKFPQPQHSQLQRHLKVVKQAGLI